MTREGVDAAWGRPSPADLVAAGKSFILVYEGPLGDPAAHASKAEIDAYRAAGIAVGFISEGPTQRMLGGAAAGATDGAAMRALLAGWDAPRNVAVYFAADWSVAPSQYAAVDDYLSSAQTNIGPWWAAVYGPRAYVEHALAAGVAHHGWQAAGWSGGLPPVAAALWQYGPQVSIGGHLVDLDRMLADDAGLWEASMDLQSYYGVEAWTVEGPGARPFYAGPDGTQLGTLEPGTAVTSLGAPTAPPYVDGTTYLWREVLVTTDRDRLVYMRRDDLAPVAPPVDAAWAAQVGALLIARAPTAKPTVTVTADPAAVDVTMTSPAPAAPQP